MRLITFARGAVEHVLELVRVVEDPVTAREVAQLVRRRERPRLDLHTGIINQVTVMMEGVNKPSAHGAQRISISSLSAVYARLEVSVLLVLQPDRCGGDGIPPHLDHPPKRRLRFRILTRRETCMITGASFSNMDNDA